jgi:UDP-N-acetylmuramate dehydrogenase
MAGLKRRMMYSLYNYSLLHHNTFGLQVKADRFVEYTSEEELQDLIAHQELSEPLLHVGKGSNLLFRGDYHGTVLHSAVSGIGNCGEDDASVTLRIGAGELWDDVVGYCTAHGYYGLENLSLIPGETGAAAVQNIGAYGAEVKDFVARVDTVDLKNGSRKAFSREECGYAYRRSVFKTSLKGRYAVTYVTLRLQKQFRPDLEYGAIRNEMQKRGWSTVDAPQLRQLVIDIRRQKLPDPAVTGNAGSFFMNPVVAPQVAEKLLADYPDMPHYVVDGGVKIPAGWLIEQSGWKGRSLGRAGVYPKQALVLVNLGGAEPDDIVNLSKAIQTDVEQRFGIAIKPEVNFI